MGKEHETRGQSAGQDKCCEYNDRQNDGNTQHFKQAINGQFVEIDREQPALTEDPVSTIFPDAPSYISKCVLKKRKILHTVTPQHRNAKLETNAWKTATLGYLKNESGPEARWHPFSDIPLSSVLCNKVVLKNGPAT